LKILRKLYNLTLCSEESELPKSSRRSSSEIDRLVGHKHMIHVLICGYNNTTMPCPIAGCSFFIRSSTEFVVTLAAVTDCSYDNTFGSGNDGKPFRRRGLMQYLLHFCRIYTLSLKKEIPTVPSPMITAFVLLRKNDPSRFYFFRNIGFIYRSFSCKTFVADFPSFSGKEDGLPLSGNEIIYSYCFGKLSFLFL
jgi:hypothetical protein